MVQSSQGQLEARPVARAPEGLSCTGPRRGPTGPPAGHGPVAGAGPRQGLVVSRAADSDRRLGHGVPAQPWSGAGAGVQRRPLVDRTGRGGHWADPVAQPRCAGTGDARG